jgi:uncharacterized protein DUF6527
MKLVRLDKAYWPRGGFGHWCPGCNATHEIDTEEKNGSGAIWSFDGNMERPTFTPSVNIRWGKYADPTYVDSEGHSGVCHYILTAGEIQFCGDCTHDLAGQKVPLPDIPPDRFVTSQRLTAKG